MNIKRRFVLWLLPGIFFAACKKEPEYVHVSMLTYNVAGLPEPISGSHPATYTSHIGRLMNAVDVVNVQEDFHYHDSLLLHNTHPYRTPFMGDAFYGDGLNTFSRLPIQGFTRIQWDDCADSDCFTPKGFTYAQLEVMPGVWIDFYNVHANAQSYEEALIARQKNIRQLCTYVQAHSEGKAVIIMGDMNCRYTRTGDSIRNVLELAFRDPWIERVRGGSLPEQNDVSLMECDWVAGSRTRPDCEKVDKIFYRSNTEVEIEPLVYQLDEKGYYYQQNDTLPLSDHWPLFTIFRITKRQ